MDEDMVSEGGVINKEAELFVSNILNLHLFDNSPQKEDSNDRGKSSSYKELATLGEGKFFIVKLGKDPDGDLVALKKFNPDCKVDIALLVAMKDNELNILNYLLKRNDPRNNFVARAKPNELIDQNINIFEPYFGGTLSHQLKSFRGNLSLRNIRIYLAQILTGLEFIHSNGIIHRDVKLNNILIDLHGCIKLCDFGSSKSFMR